MFDILLCGQNRESQQQEWDLKIGLGLGINGTLRCAAFSQEFLCSGERDVKFEFQLCCNNFTLILTPITGCGGLYMIIHRQWCCSCLLWVRLMLWRCIFTIMHLSGKWGQFYSSRKNRGNCVLFILSLHLYIPDWFVCLYSTTMLSTEQAWIHRSTSFLFLITLVFPLLLPPFVFLFWPVQQVEQNVTNSLLYIYLL